MMHNMDVLIKLQGIVSGNHLLVCFLDHKHKGKGMWFDFQQPLVWRSVA